MQAHRAPRKQFPQIISARNVHTLVRQHKPPFSVFHSCGQINTRPENAKHKRRAKPRRLVHRRFFSPIRADNRCALQRPAQTQSRKQAVCGKRRRSRQPDPAADHRQPTNRTVFVLGGNIWRFSAGQISRLPAAVLPLFRAALRSLPQSRSAPASLLPRKSVDDRLHETVCARDGYRAQQTKQHNAPQQIGQNLRLPAQ